jgi:hypothetical protein
MWLLPAFPNGELSRAVLIEISLAKNLCRGRPLGPSGSGIGSIMIILGFE